MKKLKWSSDLKEVVVVQYTLTADEALDILTKELLGADYYIADPITGPQGNAIIVRDILSKYQRKHKRLW